MLELAASALVRHVVEASRFDPASPRLQEARQAGAGMAAVVSSATDLDQVARRRSGHEHHPAIVEPTNPIPASGKALDSNRQRNDSRRAILVHSVAPAEASATAGRRWLRASSSASAAATASAATRESSRLTSSRSGRRSRN